MNKICGKILAVNISQKKGEKKNNIGCGLFLENLGLENDAHAEANIIRPPGHLLSVGTLFTAFFTIWCRLKAGHLPF
jgi:hypothetical protein